MRRPDYQITYPSSTTVLGDMGLTEDYDAIIRRRPSAVQARDMGDRIHAVLESELGRTAVPLAGEASAIERACAYEALERVADEYGGITAVLDVECRYCHSTSRYHGKRDALIRVGKYPDVDIVVDYKTGLRAKSHVPQVASYVELEMDNRDVRPARGAVIALLVYAHPERGVQLCEVGTKDLILGWQTFERALHLWWWRHDAGLLPAKER